MVHVSLRTRISRLDATKRRPPTSVICLVVAALATGSVPSFAQPSLSNDSTEAAELLLKARNGDREAMRRLGLAYLPGRFVINGIEKSYAESLLWLLAASRAGDITAINVLAKGYLNNEFPGSLFGANEACEMLARADESAVLVNCGGTAKLIAGQCFLSERPKRDPLKGIAYLSMSASENFHPLAAEALSTIYESGVPGVPKDPAKAAEWKQISIKNYANHADAMECAQASIEKRPNTREVAPDRCLELLRRVFD